MDDINDSLNIQDNPSITIKLEPDIHNVINETNFQQDELDNPDFNVIEFINKEFPNEQSLINIDPVLTKLKIKMSESESIIAKEIRHLSGTGNKASRDLEIAQTSIVNLFEKIHDIKEKADRSEQMVKEICSGIKKLDYAKRNITTTITGLKRIYMLVTGVNQLREWTKRRQYREVGNLLEAVNQLSSYFSKEEKYQSMNRIAELTKDVDEIKEELKIKVREEFFDNNDSPLSSSQLSDVCFVIDALGEDTKLHFKKTFCNNQMTDYTRTFSASDESSRLEYCDRRFLWANRKLREYEKKYNHIFPPSWRMQEMLSEYFALRTKEHFSKILEKNVPEVKILLYCIRETLKWEREMCSHYAKQPIMDSYDDYNNEEEEEEEDDDDFEDNPQSAASVERKYRRYQKQRERAEARKQPKLKPENKFKGIISSIFDKYTSIYINEEDSLMQQKLESIILNETWEIDDNARNKVLKSSTELIFYFKKSMKRCTELSCGEAFYQMYNLFKKYLRKYSTIISRKIPLIENDNSLLSESQERQICLIINTSEYCNNLCKQLASTVKSSINEEFKSKIDMKKEQQEFSGVIAKGLKALVSGLENKVKDSLNVMSRMPWGSCNTVGDQSDYVNQLSSYILQTVPLYNDWLSVTHSRFFCESFVAVFVPMLVKYIYACKVISEFGAEQLLLDITAMEKIILSMPSLTNSKGGTGNPIPARYTKNVQIEIAKPEKILKVVLCPPSSICFTFVQILPKGTDTLFTRILNLKSIPKSEHPSYFTALRREKIKEEKYKKEQQNKK